MGEDPRHELKILAADHIVPVLVDDSVTIKKYSGMGHAFS
jgi:hypothetical protein